MKISMEKKIFSYITISFSYGHGIITTLLELHPWTYVSKLWNFQLWREKGRGIIATGVEVQGCISLLFPKLFYYNNCG